MPDHTLVWIKSSYECGAAPAGVTFFVMMFFYHKSCAHSLLTGWLCGALESPRQRGT